jgi:hypothetical protein
MRKLITALFLVLILASAPLADNSMYYGTYEVKGKVGNTAYDFQWALGSKDYTTQAGAQWQGVAGMSWIPCEYVATSPTTSYYYTQLPAQGTQFQNEGLFFEDGSISAATPVGVIAERPLSTSPDSM